MSETLMFALFIVGVPAFASVPWWPVWVDELMQKHRATYGYQRKIALAHLRRPCTCGACTAFWKRERQR